MHVGGFRRAGAEVTALCGRSAEKTAAIASREGIALATTDLRALCAACEVVVVASPDKLHGPHVRAALDAGKHVLCEKPLAQSAAEADALAGPAAATGQATAVSCAYTMLQPFAAMPA